MTAWEWPFPPTWNGIDNSGRAPVTPGRYELASAQTDAAWTILARDKEGLVRAGATLLTHSSGEVPVIKPERDYVDWEQ